MNNSRDERRMDAAPTIVNTRVEHGPQPDHHGPAPDHHGPKPERHSILKAIKPVPIPVPVIDPIPPRRYRVLHRYGLGYDYGYGYEYGYNYDPDYFLPYDPKYVDNKRKIGVLAAVSTCTAGLGALSHSPVTFTLGLGGLAAASVASVVNKIKRKIRFEDQQREEYERSLAM